ncbi:tRNA wybutosine-synthesizing protein 3 [Cladobotryum mycophilum]|uniref:tRNA(Phe) 7-[(3-amino-3-carboxypropyl)-4-demethylwyosine(37)-N(4)]-methyltransferase n=1 Tax=Cladobotryum mycophilum TaxID=491253 RepID=A0ABR0SH92_9HYPO
MHGLAPPTAGFAEKKAKILQQLAVPDAEYTDASPKGSVDEGIRHLIDEINGAEGFVTTSSCAGRMSVFLEGRKTRAANDEGEGEQVAGVGGKGAGGTWLYVSHEADANGGETYMDWMSNLGLVEGAEAFQITASHGGEGNKDRRLIHFKFEPMILHVLTASLAHAQPLLRCALQAGFRESGAVNVTSPTGGDQPMPMVAVRSMGLGLESLIGYEESDGQRRRIVQPEYLQMLLRISNERFVENTKRIERFRSAFRDDVLEPKAKTKKNSEGEEWEDPVVRRERMKAEGLRRKAALQAEQEKATTQLTEPS